MLVLSCQFYDRNFEYILAAIVFVFSCIYVDLNSIKCATLSRYVMYIL